MNTARATTGRDWVEIVATVLLALRRRRHGVEQLPGEPVERRAGQGDAGRVNALRIDAARAQGLAEGQTQVDVAMFFQWIDATATDETELADFYLDRFRAEFRPAFDAWQATDPLDDPAAPPSPFAMDEYQLQAAADAERLDAEAEVMAAIVRRNIQRSANYVLGVVLFAVALFFAGMSTKSRGAGPRKALRPRRLRRVRRRPRRGSPRSRSASRCRRQITPRRRPARLGVTPLS